MVQPIYVGDTRNLATRIRSNHLVGEIEGSAFRKHIAKAMGLTVLKRRRPNGSVQRRVAEPDGEARISKYVSSGFWRVFRRDTYEQATELQWFAIDRLHPIWNRKSGEWPRGIENTLNDMLGQLQSSPALRGDALDQLPSAPGVYVFYHDPPSRENSPPMGMARHDDHRQPER